MLSCAHAPSTFVVIVISLILVCVSQGILEPLQIKKCKHGDFLLSSHDLHVSKHLSVYGEWAEKELELFLKIIKPGDIVIDAGANIGAFTVPLAKAVGPLGRVHSFEPQRIINQRLNANVAINELYNVHTYLTALGNETSSVNIPLIDYSADGNFAAISLADANMFAGMLYETVPVTTLDSIDFTHRVTMNDCPSFIKIDVELMERFVLQGAQKLIARCKPLLYVENPCVMTSLPLIALIYELDYVPYWDVQPTYHSEEFEGKIDDISPGQYAINMLCIPKSRLKNTVDSTDGGDHVSKGDIAMIGYMAVERNMPYLHQYFDGRYKQAGDETTCGEGGVHYVQD